MQTLFMGFSPGLRLLLQLGFVIFTPPPHGLDHRPQGLPEGAEAVFHVGRHGVVVDFFHDAVADHGFQGGGQDLLERPDRDLRSCAGRFGPVIRSRIINNFHLLSRTWTVVATSQTGISSRFSMGDSSLIGLGWNFLCSFYGQPLVVVVFFYL